MFGREGKEQESMPLSSCMYHAKSGEDIRCRSVCVYVCASLSESFLANAMVKEKLWN